MDKQIAENEGAFVELQESQKQIEELHDFILNNLFEGTTYLLAEKLYRAGYRKIHENVVVLTPAERDEEMRLIREDVIERMEATRKETAEKYHTKVNEAIDSVPNATKEFVEAWKAKNDKIAKEITEDEK